MSLPQALMLCSGLPHWDWRPVACLWAYAYCGQLCRLWSLATVCVAYLQVANMADEHTDYMLTAHHYAVSEKLQNWAGQVVTETTCSVCCAHSLLPVKHLQGS
jgi:hypothetical protein